MAQQNQNLSIWIGNIPSNAKINQLLGALNAQGYKAMNAVKLKTAKANNTQWTVVTLQNMTLKQKAIQYGIKFGNPPVALNVKNHLNVQNLGPNRKGPCRYGVNCNKRSTCPFDHPDSKENSTPNINKDGSTKPFRQNNRYQNQLQYQKYQGSGNTTGGRSASYNNNNFGNKYKNNSKITPSRSYNSYQKGRRPQNVGFYMTAIIDLSGSMAGSRIKAATSGLSGLLRNLKDNDYISIIGFNSKVIKILDPTPYGKVKEAIPKSLSQCIDNVGGGTAMWDAMNAALTKQKEFLQKNQYQKKTKRKQRIIVVTDGEDNKSTISADEVIQTVAYLNMHQAKQQFALTVIAVGEATQSKKLIKLCQPNYCHLIAVNDFHGIAKAIGNSYSFI